MSWTNRQKAMLGAYRRYAGWPDDFYRQQLQRCTGYRTSTDRRLTQEDYDHIMPIVEAAAHLAHINGMGTGRTPRRQMNWTYWRDRRPPDGQLTSRQARMIWTLLQRLSDLNGQRYDLAYMVGMLERAGGGPWPDNGSVGDLLAWQASMLIEALKGRIQQEERKQEGPDS